ncbi:4'-phosphopantetheinyl transferase family protein [Millionella massiliensis]|uniref:4'-phosphopantetheinyl transferase family protein n=1 Tax=Millionella massiliensis TaxID=1871023 RepID=UPI0023A7CA05|nr:4'-phosphopantetheinyl transferase superfamily protein [Millionella massiliensis]
MATAPITKLTVRHGTLYLLPLDAVTETELTARANLSAADAARFERIDPRQEQRRKEWLGSRVIAREALATSIGYTPEGRPCALDRNDLHLSISHTTGWVALMASPYGPCGVDIERASRPAARVANRIATPDEIALGTPFLPSNPGLVIWCAKEAAYKALGTPGIDFRQQIRLHSTTAQTLLLTVNMNDISLEVFFWKDLIAVCGSFRKKSIT